MNRDLKKFSVTAALALMTVSSQLLLMDKINFSLNYVCYTHYMVYLSLSRVIRRAGKHKALLNKWTISESRLVFFLKIKEKKPVMDLI